MVNEQQLSAVLSEFARTLVTDYPIEGILDHLVERIVDVLPITSAGVTLIAPGKRPRYVAASDDDALRFEKVQTSLGEGPCVAAWESGDAISMPDLVADERYPGFREMALSGGLAAVFTFPLHCGDGRLGALDLYRDTRGQLDPRDMTVAQTLADVVSAYLINAQIRYEAAEAAEMFRESALHDALTGLPNRTLLHQRLEHAAQRARRSHSNAAVLYADLDKFKQVNDRFGHGVGDALLVAVAGRLSALLRPGDTLARVSGDEFVILCEDLRSASDVEGLATRIRQAFGLPFVVSSGSRGPIELSITASVGMAFAGRGEDIGHQLVHEADTAMYQAKRMGRAAHQFIDTPEAGRTAHRIQLQQDLRAALAHDELQLAYQPIVRAADGLVIGVEALLRWMHPTRGSIAPQVMVSIAEQDSLIAEIGAWVLHRGCEDRRGWLRSYPGLSLELSVNVSAHQLVMPGFRDTVTRILDETGMDPAALTLEVTEGVFLDNASRAGMALAELKELGLRLALDDFGTGYSSLSYLRRFPVDVVKIDKGFVAEIGQSTGSGTIIAAVTNLAHALGLSVTAEGVETPEQRDEVIAIGCESAQGFHYGRPIPATDLTAWLQTSAQGVLHLPDWRMLLTDV